VRAVLADLFLQLLETGEAQSAKGAPFSCANLIFCFTLNLPAGADERLRRGMGFTPSHSLRDLRLGVEDELKKLFSNAFLSRVGTPILFDPLSDTALAAILERGIAAALVAAARRRRIENITVELALGLGARLLAVIAPNSLSHGARGLLEIGRTLAARAFLELIERQSTGLEGTTWQVSATAAGGLTVGSGLPSHRTTIEKVTR
jgi:ATP-dependent Clp protease ATP-binding subunit ClpA